MADKKHITKVAPDDDAGEEFENLYGDAYLAKCSCGWSERRTTEERGYTSAAAHEAHPDLAAA